MPDERSPQPGPDSPRAEPGRDPAEHAPAGPDETAEKTVAPAGPGATSWEDAASETTAAREAGEYAAAVAGVDPAAAAPIPADDTAALADPDAASSEPAGSAPKSLRPEDLGRSAGSGTGAGADAG